MTGRLYSEEHHCLVGQVVLDLTYPYAVATCFLPNMRSITAVSAYPCTRTVLPSRRVNTCATSLVSLSAVVSPSMTTVSPSARKRWGVAVIGTADRAVARLDPLDVVVEQVHDRVDVTGGEGFIALFDQLDVLFLL